MASVARAVSEFLSRYLEENPKEAKKIMAKVVFEAESREKEAAARKAAEGTQGDPQRRRYAGQVDGLQPTRIAKAANCSSSRVIPLALCEQGRDRKYHAILPLRG